MREKTLHIHLLGPLEAVFDGAHLSLPPSRKARALLAYLATTQREHSRVHLCDLLWDGPADPRAALRTALSRLRPILDGGAIRLQARGEFLRLSPSATQVDLHAARDVVENVRDADISELSTIAGTFRGRLLDGLDLPRCIHFDSWCTAQRESARRMHVSILQALADRLRNEPGEALVHARRWLLLEPAAEAAHLEVIRLLLKLDRPRDALSQYETCRRILKSELGMAPSPELEAVRRAFGSQGRSHRSQKHSRASDRAQDRSGETEFVGRDSELERILSARPDRVLLLTGEPGIGKTRLLSHVQDLIEGADGRVLIGRAFDSESARPFGAWIEAFRELEYDCIPRELQVELGPLFPGLSETNDSGRTSLFEAAGELLEFLALDANPFIVALDDLQWVDESSAALLHFIARSTSPPVRLVLTAREAEVAADNAAFRLVNTLRGEGLLSEHTIGPLGQLETVSLAGNVNRASDGQLIFERTAGHPLFTVELARDTESGNGATPDNLHSLIGARLDRLDTAAKWLVPWAAALGHNIDIDVLGNISELPATDLLKALEALEKHRILRAGGAHYEFSHELVREIAYLRISEPRRVLIHARIARELEARNGFAGEVAGELAHHAGLAGENDVAARACLAAARYALWGFAPAEAAQLARSGIEYLENISAEDRLELHVELLGLSIFPGMKHHRPADIESDLATALAEARAAGLKESVSRGFHHIAYLHYLNGDFSGALAESLRAKDAAREADPVAVVRAIGDSARCLGILERDMPRAAQLAREADALARGIGYQGHELAQAIGYVHHHEGELDEAIACFDRAAHLARAEHERWFECTCLTRAVMIDLELDRPEHALGRCTELVELACNLGEGGDGPFARALESLAGIRLQQEGAYGRLADALSDLRKADSRWMIAYVQNSAAQLDLGAGNLAAADRRITEANDAAALIQRTNEMIISKSLGIRLESLLGHRDRAGKMLHALKSELPDPGVLSARAIASVQAVINECPSTSHPRS